MRKTPDRTNYHWALRGGTMVLVLLIASSVRGQTPVPVDARRRVALVVGNDAYQGNPLKNSANDATDMSAVLTELNFQVQLVLNSTRAQLEQAIERFVLSLQKDDVVLFYYSGHGLQLEGENYIVPIEYRAITESDAKYAAYSLSAIVDRITSKSPSLSIVILDACRDNPYSRTRSFGRGLAPMTASNGVFIAFATAPGQTASDNQAGKNGLFTGHLLDGLAEPGLSIDTLFNRVRRKVYSESQGKQLPWAASSVIGDFTFRSNSVHSPLLSHTTGAHAADNVIAEVTRSIATDRTPVGFKVRGGAFLASGKADKAIADFTEAVNLDPQYTEAYRGRAKALILNGDLVGALKDLTKVLSQEPQDAVSRYRRSLLNSLLGNVDDATSDATEAIRLRPEMAEAYLSRSVVYLSGGRYADAIVDSSKAIALAPDLALAYSTRGDAYANLGDAVQAKRDFDVATQQTRLHGGK